MGRRTSPSLARPRRDSGGFGRGGTTGAVSSGLGGETTGGLAATGADVASVAFAAVVTLGAGATHVLARRRGAVVAAAPRGPQGS
ncbi:hypothetical protein LX15_002614 [Streptoalloteichus tenebrarius]|uniref:LPXTG cell wall anchor domain-containing protein n=1 Tax=Streptoalloteichus tenebrarius (strain ATCC 17920 / DSM 40477 / JCM 4838 / CBS 697.72 / NBRC 16177 / NCIMB 11028 / NRRL B-12390 / A12253. 1 / ISP 5477) TaxID=1933 RepID=A0ABT1HTQ8_STRSD|nr:hypothetical protein [Streptoalloteichus tenebrarius]